jgi:hypothetical protein
LLKKIDDEEIKKEVTLFEHLNNLTNTKVDLDENDSEETKNYVPYIINRFVSMCNLYIPYVNEINKYNISKKLHYKYFQTLLPQRRQFFQYIKKKKDINTDIKQKIAQYFQIGMKEVDLYVNILTEEQFKEICTAFDYGRKGSSSKA